MGLDNSLYAGGKHHKYVNRYVDKCGCAQIVYDGGMLYEKGVYAVLGTPPYHAHQMFESG